MEADNRNQDLNELAQKMKEVLSRPEAANIRNLFGRMEEIQEQTRQLSLELFTELNRPELADGKEVLSYLLTAAVSLCPRVMEEMAKADPEEIKRKIDNALE